MVLGTGKVLRPDGVSSHGSSGHQVGIARTGRSWRWNLPKSLLHPLHATAGTAETKGGGGARRLGAWRSLVPGGPRAEKRHRARGHCRAALYKAMKNTAGSNSLKGAGVASLACFFQLSLMIKLKKSNQTQMAAGAMITLIFSIHSKPLRALFPILTTCALSTFLTVGH